MFPRCSNASALEFFRETENIRARLFLRRRFPRLLSRTRSTRKHAICHIASNLFRHVAGYCNRVGFFSKSMKNMSANFVFLEFYSQTLILVTAAKKSAYAKFNDRYDKKYVTDFLKESTLNIKLSRNELYKLNHQKHNMYLNVSSIWRCL